MAMVLASLASYGQDVNTTKDSQVDLASIDSKAVALLRETARQFESAGDLEACNVLLALSYFIQNRDRIISGKWQEPDPGQDEEWERVQKSFRALKSGAASQENVELTKKLEELLGFRDRDTTEGGAVNIQIQDLNGYDVRISEVGTDFSIELHAISEATPSKDTRDKTLAKLKSMFSDPRLHRKIDEMMKEPFDPKHFSNLDKQTGAKRSAEGQQETLTSKYLALSAEALRVGKKEEALHSEVIGYLLHYLADAIRALRALNGYRRKASLDPVGYSALLSFQCALHSRYLALEDPERTAGSKGHLEETGSPYFTPFGLEAGKASVIMSGDLTSSVHCWMRTLYHRIPLINPYLEKVGLGRWKPGRTNECCLDAKTGVGHSGSEQFVQYPAASQKDVPRSFSTGRESPDPLPQDAESAGFPVTITCFPFSTSLIVENVRAVFSRGGSEVPCWISWPGRPANASRKENSSSICMIPKEPLKKDCEYTVKVEATINGKTKVWEWSFHTRTE